MNGMPIADRARRSGNGLILGVERADGGWLVRFAPEPRTSPQPLWFHVEVRGLAGAPVTFCWENPDITLGDSSRLDTLRPVLRADAAPPERVTQTRVETLPDGRRRILFAHAGGADSVAASLCYPYGPEDRNNPLTLGLAPLGVTGRGGARVRPRRRAADRALPGAQHAGRDAGSGA